MNILHDVFPFKYLRILYDWYIMNKNVHEKHFIIVGRRPIDSDRMCDDSPCVNNIPAAAVFNIFQARDL